ncbi:MAG: Fis family transcriptional regulator [Deltaproteobacteria bacterium RBG_13_52_11]|nr:MAG: Fis family transcriptional regulator [Deltaproteobacteria bacterium RBG_13_52_11]
MGGIFKAYDIRGSYPDELNEATAKKIGAAFVLLLNAQSIVIGRDMRLSSSALAKAFIEGAIASGASVTDIGMTSTPLLYYAIIDGRFDGGVMVTASHLPGGMNGLKLCREEAIALSGDQGLPDLERLVHEGLPVQRSHPSGGSYQELDMVDRYIEKLSSFVHNPRPLKIVVDAGNGMAGPEVSGFFKRVPIWTLIPLYMEPDGRFPHHIANPLLPSATRDLQAMVRRENADIGVAFDGDADRCGFIDEKGGRIPEALVTALIGEFLLTKEPGATILYDLRSSRIVPETITRLGGKAVRTRVGHAFIKATLREENALFAGELSGHYYYRDMGFTDNAIFTMIQMLNFLSLKDIPLSRLIHPLQKYYATGEINIRVKDKDAVFTALEENYKDARKDHLDGLSIEYDAWWFNLRASNTEPLMRLNLEANDATTQEEKKKEILETIGKADPSMKMEE